MKRMYGGNAEVEIPRAFRTPILAVGMFMGAGIAETI